MPLEYLGAIYRFFEYPFLEKRDNLLCPCEKAVNWSCKIENVLHELTAYVSHIGKGGRKNTSGEQAYGFGHSVFTNIIWASTRENLSLGDCEKQRRRPACASAQSDQRLFSLFGKYYIQTCNMRIFNFLPSLCS